LKTHSPNIYFEVCSFTSFQNKTLGKYSISLITVNNRLIIENHLSKNTELIIYNLSGKILLKKKLYGDKVDIDLSMINNGIYIVKVLSDKEIVVKKIIKM